jgi:Ulp1 family protease
MYDCGVYICIYMLLSTLDKRFEFTHDVAEKYRLKICKYLIDGRIEDHWDVTV